MLRFAVTAALFAGITLFAGCATSSKATGGDAPKTACACQEGCACPDKEHCTCPPPAAKTACNCKATDGSATPCGCGEACACPAPAAPAPAAG